MNFSDILEQNGDYKKSLDDAVEAQEKPAEAVVSDVEEGLGIVYPLLYEYFGLEGKVVTKQEKQRLSMIAEYIGGEGKDEIVGRLRKLENRIKEPRQGVTRINNIYQYLKLSNEAKKHFAELKEYEDRGDSEQRPGESVVTISIENSQGKSD